MKAKAIYAKCRTEPVTPFEVWLMHTLPLVPMQSSDGSCTCAFGSSGIYEIRVTELVIGRTDLELQDRVYYVVFRSAPSELHPVLFPLQAIKADRKAATIRRIPGVGMNVFYQQA